MINLSQNVVRPIEDLSLDLTIGSLTDLTVNTGVTTMFGNDVVNAKTATVPSGRHGSKRDQVEQPLLPSVSRIGCKITILKIGMKMINRNTISG